MSSVFHSSQHFLGLHKSVPWNLYSCFGIFLGIYINIKKRKENKKQKKKTKKQQQQIYMI